MAIRGPKPKPAGQTVHRNRLIHEWTEVENVPFDGGPDLPARRANGRTWQKEVRDTWDAWRSMPHCKLWGPPDWRFALGSIDLAALIHDGETRFATELRNREKVMGTTLDSRRDLRIRYVEPKVERQRESADVMRLEDYRNL